MRRWKWSLFFLVLAMTVIPVVGSLSSTSRHLIPSEVKIRIQSDSLSACDLKSSNVNSCRNATQVQISEFNDEVQRHETVNEEEVALRVKVEDSCGGPVVGVWVGARQGVRRWPWPDVPNKEQLREFSKTDASGIALLKNIPRGMGFEIGSWGKNWALSSKRIVAPRRSSSQIMDISLKLYRGNDVQVTVIDRQGKPVTGAEVRIQVGSPTVYRLNCMGEFWGNGDSAKDEEGNYLGYEQSDRSDGNGNVSFVSVPSGIRTIRWRAPSFANCGSIEFGPKAIRLTVRADPGGNVSGVVLDRDGEPLGGAKIFIFATSDMPDEIENSLWGRYDHLSKWDVRAVSDSASGQFHIQGIKWYDWYQLKVEYGEVVFEIPWRQCRPGDLKIQLPSYHIVRGRLKGWEDLQADWDFEVQEGEEEWKGNFIEAPDIWSMNIQPDGSFEFICESSEFNLELGTKDRSFFLPIKVSADLDLGDISIPPMCWREELD